MPFCSTLLALVGLDAQRLRPLEKIALTVGMLLSSVAFLVSLQDVTRYAGIDFRNRVVGARVLLTGQNPYTFEWQSGMPEELLDPCHDDKAHRLTAPPPTLFAYALIAPLPYRAQRLLSCLLEWFALALSVVLLARTVVDERQRVGFLLTAMFFFALGLFWRMHVERGQVYVFHLLVLSGAANLCARHGLNSWGAGFFFGVAALLRPNYLLVAPGLLLMRQSKSGLGMLATFVVGVAATVPFLHAGSWASYLQTGDQYFLALWAPDSLPTRVPPPHDGPVEGVDFLQHLHDLTSTSFAVFNQKLRAAGWLPVLDLGFASKCLLAVLAFALILVARKPAGAGRDPRMALGVLVCFALMSDFFLPHRWGYVDVMLLLPLGVLWPYLCDDSHAGRAVAVLAGIGLVAGACLIPQLSLYYATLARSWLVTGSLTTLAALKWTRTTPLAGSHQ